jgi:mono/diheme cytochrome c family protein
MRKEQRMRFRGGLTRVVMVAAVAGTVGGCWLLPDDGYDKVAYRERDPLPAPAAPAPPPLVAGLGGSAAPVPQLAAGAPAGVTQEMVDEGAQQFGTVCAACHGAGGAGTAAGPVLSDGAWLHISGSFEEIAQIIQTGVATPIEAPAPMPPMGGGNFNDEQVRQLAAYVFALSHQAP